MRKEKEAERSVLECKDIGCPVSSLCEQVAKLGVAPTPDWLGVLLFVRNLVGDLDFLSPDEKASLQRDVLAMMGDSVHTGQERLSGSKRIIARSLRSCSYVESLERDILKEKEISASIIGEVNDFLTESGLFEAKQKELLNGFGRNVAAMSKSEGEKGSIIAGLRALFDDYAAAVNKEISEWKAKAIILEHALKHDSLLTMIYNRGEFDRYIPQAVSNCRKLGAPLTLLMLDLDNFKNGINDKYGHAVGDDALRAVAGALKACAEPLSGFVARYGGDEFAIVLETCARHEAEALAASIRAAVSQTEFFVNAQRGSRERLVLSVSIGCAELSDDMEDHLALTETADRALYLDKAHNRITRAS